MERIVTQANGQRNGYPGPRELEGLIEELRHRTQAEVRFDDGSRATYSTDASNYRQIPIGVVIPREVDDILATVSCCRQYGVPVLPRGGGTSLAGQTCNVAVVIDCSKYLNHVLEIDPDRKIATVQPGVVLDDLRDAAEAYHLTYGPDPATHDRCTLGGMIGNNSCGVHSLMSGMTSDNVDTLDVLTYDGLRFQVGGLDPSQIASTAGRNDRQGQIYRQLRALRDRYSDQIRAKFPPIPRLVSGYGLQHLLPEKDFNVARALVGSEGTCVFVLGAQVRLVHSPPSRVLVVIGYPDIYQACDDLPRLLDLGPIGLEGFDERLVNDMRRKKLHLADLSLLPEGHSWLLAEFGGETSREAQAAAQRLIDTTSTQHVRAFTSREDQARLWTVRESALGATAVTPGKPEMWEGWEDSAVPPDRLSDYLRDLRRLMDQYGYAGAFYGHFGQGCVHVRMDFDLTTASGIAKFRSFDFDAAHLVVSYGGSISGEHGDGQARAELLPIMFGQDLVEAFEKFKAIWDPDNGMNPGKVVKPYRIDQNLRLGLDYDPPAVSTYFRYPNDHDDFSRAILRCVGVGKCRRHDGGTMCPSYMVTREEEHSTRGRARLLFEMLRGSPIDDGWQSEPVKEALDLCLACKGCKGDCPVEVDMATYKAEFLAHYYAGRRRPRSAYAFGLIMYWARLAQRFPWLVNLSTKAPGLSNITKWTVGAAPERRIPTFAPRTFRQWFQARQSNPPTGRRVVLWPDTFNDHFHPATAIAAVDVLESLGYSVEIPQPWLCCGRPLYDYGLLTQAKGMLSNILVQLATEIADGVPVIGLEPSCVAVFRDELINLFPDDENAQRLSKQTFLFSEFLDREAPAERIPRLEGQALVHGHCHEKAIMGMGNEESLLRKTGLDYRVLDSGCCGMAGAFGFEKGEHYRVSIACGERVLLPEVRRAPAETFIITDGFSCREQVAQTTNRQTLHTAELLWLALHQYHPTKGERPEKAFPASELLGREPVHLESLGLAVGAATLLAGLLLRQRKRPRRRWRP